MYKQIFYLGKTEQKHGVLGLEDMDQKMKLKAKRKYYKADKTGSSKGSCQYVACVAGAWKYEAQERTAGRTRETREGRGSACPRGPWNYFFHFIRVRKIPVG